MMNEPLSSIMTSELITLGPTATLSNAMDLLGTKRIHHLPVVDGKKLVGLITTYDLFKIDRNKEEFGDILLEEVMTRKLATLESGDKIGTAAEIFLAHLFHAIPVVDNGDLVGIVTTHDVMKYCFRKEYTSGMPWTK